MLSDRIPSKADIKLIRSLGQKKFREELGLFVVEGEKMVGEALTQKRFPALPRGGGLPSPRCRGRGYGADEPSVVSLPCPCRAAYPF